MVPTSASVYRRLQESPRQPPGGLSTWGPPPAPALSPGSPLASGRLLKSESEDSGVEMASNEHSPCTPLGSESSFSLDGFPPEKKSPPREEPGPEPPRTPRSRSGSKKLLQAAQRSKRQRLPGRCPRLRGEHAWDPREQEEPSTADPEAAVGAGRGCMWLGGGRSATRQALSAPPGRRLCLGRGCGTWSTSARCWSAWPGCSRTTGSSGSRWGMPGAPALTPR